jgi:hypothetical protein
MMAVTPIAPVSPVGTVDMTAWARLIDKTAGVADTVTNATRRAISRREVLEEKEVYYGDFYIYNRGSVFQDITLRSGLILDRYI